MKGALGVCGAVPAGDDAGELSEISHEMGVIRKAAVRGNGGDRGAVALDHRLQRPMEALHAEIANRRQTCISAKARNDRFAAQARLARECVESKRPVEVRSEGQCLRCRCVDLRRTK